MPATKASDEKGTFMISLNCQEKSDAFVSGAQNQQ
jgi:hypothetical protein